MKLIKVKRKLGCIYEGIVFSDGKVIIHWLNGICPSVTIIDNFEQFKKVYLDTNPDKNAEVEIRDI